jgi:hypothetical protein
MAGLIAEVPEDHVREHLVDTGKYSGALDPDSGEQPLDIRAAGRTAKSRTRIRDEAYRTGRAEQVVGDMSARSRQLC